MESRVSRSGFYSVTWCRWNKHTNERAAGGLERGRFAKRPALVRRMGSALLPHDRRREAISCGFAQRTRPASSGHLLFTLKADAIRRRSEGKASVRGHFRHALNAGNVSLERPLSTRFSPLRYINDSAAVPRPLRSIFEASNSTTSMFFLTGNFGLLWSIKKPIKASRRI